MKQKPLSEKWIKGEIFYRALDVEDVKEAVEKLKEELGDNTWLSDNTTIQEDLQIVILHKIDKIFGEFK